MIVYFELRGHLAWGTLTGDVRIANGARVREVSLESEQAGAIGYVPAAVVLPFHESRLFYDADLTEMVSAEPKQLTFSWGA